MCIRDSCTVVKYNFYYCRTSRSSYVPVFQNMIWSNSIQCIMCSVALPLLYPRTRANAIARLAHTRCLRGHREKNGDMWRVFRLSAQRGAREPIFAKRVPGTCLGAETNILGYRTRKSKFKRLEPHFQLSATRSASKEGTETAAALPHSRECTKEPISALPIIVQRKSSELEQKNGMSYMKN